jgi:hypothetical protein
MVNNVISNLEGQKRVQNQAYQSRGVTLSRLRSTSKSVSKPSLPVKVMSKMEFKIFGASCSLLFWPPFGRCGSFLGLFRCSSEQKNFFVVLRACVWSFFVWCVVFIGERGKQLGVPFRTLGLFVALAS